MLWILCFAAASMKNGVMQFIHFSSALSRSSKTAHSAETPVSCHGGHTEAAKARRTLRRRFVGKCWVGLGYTVGQWGRFKDDTRLTLSGSKQAASEVYEVAYVFASVSQFTFFATHCIHTRSGWYYRSWRAANIDATADVHKLFLLQGHGMFRFISVELKVCNAPLSLWE